MKMNPKAIYYLVGERGAGETWVLLLRGMQKSHDLGGTLRRTQPAWRTGHQAWQALDPEAIVQNIEGLSTVTKRLTHRTDGTGIHKMRPQHFVFDLHKIVRVEETRMLVEDLISDCAAAPGGHWSPPDAHHTRLML
jgi:hypothetical protein